MVCREGRWRPFSTSKGEPHITSLFVADDVVLFAKASKEQANMVKECLDSFYNAFGQRVSAQKSTVYFSPNTNEGVMVDIYNILQMKKVDDLGKYLRVPTNKRVTRATYQDRAKKTTR